MKVREQWFIENVEFWDIEETSVCLHLTNYNLPSPEKIEDMHGRPVSPLRWVFLENASVRPGGADGTLLVGDHNFKLTYAWGGLNSKEDYHTLLSYTVKVEGPGCGVYFSELSTQIAEFEGQKSCVGAKIGIGTMMLTIKPYDLSYKEGIYKPRING